MDNIHKYYKRCYNYQIYLQRGNKMSQTNVVGTHKTSIFTDDDGFTKVVYHSTPVVKFNQSEIRLDSGGWMTNTTKLRMNQASNQFKLGFNVYQKNYEWFIDYIGKTFNYSDGITLFRNDGVNVL